MCGCAILPGAQSKDTRAIAEEARASVDSTSGTKWSEGLYILQISALTTLLAYCSKLNV